MLSTEGSPHLSDITISCRNLYQLYTATVNNRAIALSGLHCVILHVSHSQPLMGNFNDIPHGQKQFKHRLWLSWSWCHLRSGSTVIPHKTTETLVCWVKKKEYVLLFAGDTGKPNVPAMTQCPQIKALKYGHSICQFSDTGWMFSWWCGGVGGVGDITVSSSHLCALGQ